MRARLPTTAETSGTLRQIAACTGVDGGNRDGTSRRKVQKNAARSERLGGKTGRRRDCPETGRVQPSGAAPACGDACVTGMSPRTPGGRRRDAQEAA